MILFKSLTTKCISGGLFFIVSSYVSALGISTNRIALDQNNNENNFVITNRETDDKTCSLSLIHYKFNESGKLLNYEKDEKIIFSAENHIRFSPKTFDIKANSKQKVRFVMRRKKSALAQELRSHLAVSCKVKNVVNSSVINPLDNTTSLSIRPVLVHHIPIVVRPTKIENVTAEIKNVTYENGAFNFDLFRSGDRSIYGTVSIINIDTNEKVTESKLFPIYVESTKKNLTLHVGNDFPPKQLLLQFVEDKSYGGTLIAEGSVVN